MKFRKTSFSLIFIIFPLVILAQAKVNVSIQNNSALERKASIVAIPWKTIISKYPQIDTTNFVVINSVTKKQIPFQLEHCGLHPI